MHHFVTLKIALFHEAIWHISFLVTYYLVHISIEIQIIFPPMRSDMFSKWSFNFLSSVFEPFLLY